jgi:hypothetical protein
MESCARRGLMARLWSPNVRPLAAVQDGSEVAGNAKRYSPSGISERRLPENFVLEGVGTSASKRSRGSWTTR